MKRGNLITYLRIRLSGQKFWRHFFRAQTFPGIQRLVFVFIFLVCLSSKKLFWSSIVSSLNAWKFVFKRNKYSVTFKKDKKYITFEQNLIKRLSCPTKCFYFWAAIIAKWICP